MNINKLFLLSILSLSVATIRPNAPEGLVSSINKAVTQISAPDEATVTYPETWSEKYITKTILPGIIVGGFTGTAIGYLSGTLFDAMFNGDIVQALIKSYGKSVPVAGMVALARLGAQVGSKWYWEKPLRNKIMNWLQNDMKQNGVEFNEELMKTLARVSAWLGCTSQLDTGYFFYSLREFYHRSITYGI